MKEINRFKQVRLSIIMTNISNTTKHHRALDMLGYTNLYILHAGNIKSNLLPNKAYASQQEMTSVHSDLLCKRSESPPVTSDRQKWE